MVYLNVINNKFKPSHPSACDKSEIMHAINRQTSQGDGAVNADNDNIAMQQHPSGSI